MTTLLAQGPHLATKIQLCILHHEATSCTWLFKCEFHWIEIKHSVPQMHHPHCQGSGTTWN
jgi:hypothetical protein